MFFFCLLKKHGVSHRVRSRWSRISIKKEWVIRCDDEHQLAGVGEMLRKQIDHSGEAVEGGRSELP